MVPITIRFVILLTGILGKFKPGIEGDRRGLVLGAYHVLSLAWRAHAPFVKKITPLLKKCTLHIIIKHKWYIARF